MKRSNSEKNSDFSKTSRRCKQFRAGAASRPGHLRKETIRRAGTNKTSTVGEIECRKIVECMDDCVAVVRDGKIVFGNSCFEKRTRYVSKTGLRDFFSIFDEKDRQRIMAFFEKVRKRGGAAERVSVDMKVNDGPARAMDVKASLIEFGGKPAILAVMRDDAERMLLEADRRQIHKMKAIGTFAGGIAHQMNNILGVILGNAEMAIEDVPEHGLAGNSLEEIREATLRGKKAVARIMEFAMEGRIKKTPAVFARLVEEALEKIVAAAPPGVKVEKDISSGLKAVAAGPSEIERIVANLCDNSVNAMEGASGIVKISADSIRLGDKDEKIYGDIENGDYVRLTVEDSGCGIDPDIMDRIFDPHFSTKNLSERSGMGLAVVYTIARRAGGAVRVTSRVGEGTAVEVLFPSRQIRPENRSV